MKCRFNESRNYMILDNGETVWPSPYPTNSLEWRFRYAQETLKTEDFLHAASIMSAYEALITSTQKRRNDVCKQMKKLLEDRE
jgi:hypothetical protein